MLSDDRQLLFQTYQLHTELAQRVDEVREGLNKIFSGMVSSIIVASVLLQRFMPDSESMWLFPALGFFISLSWIISHKSLTGKLTAKNEILKELEKKLPFDFLTRENEYFETKGFPRRKLSGIIMPVFFLVICIIWALSLLVPLFSQSR